MKPQAMTPVKKPPPSLSPEQTRALYRQVKDLTASLREIEQKLDDLASDIHDMGYPL